MVDAWRQPFPHDDHLDHVKNLNCVMKMVPKLDCSFRDAMGKLYEPCNLYVTFYICYYLLCCIIPSSSDNPTQSHRVMCFHYAAFTAYTSSHFPSLITIRCHLTPTLFIHTNNLRLVPNQRLPAPESWTNG